MLFCWNCGMAVLAGFLFAVRLHAQFTFDPREHEGMEATLTVAAGEQTTERGLGEVTLTLTITGPPALEVEEPRLGDAAAAWKEERLPSTRRVEGQHAVWEQVIRLQQVKRGMEPVPDLTVRFRRGTDAEWMEEKWIDILRHVRDGTEIPQAGEERPSLLRRWEIMFALAVTALLILLAWLRKRRRVPRQAPLPPDRWALREMERIETTLMPPQGNAELYHTQISFIVRRYLAERFGLHALQQTTTEFLEAIRQLPQLAAEEQALLAELLARCDLAKFARADASPEECQRTAELARNLVQQTSVDLSLRTKR
jgi:hypothetical protein